jgi:arabinofuranosyltransferase
VAARWLEKHAPPNATVASTPAGSIAYYMNLKVIDMLGLNDIHIARTEVENPGMGRAGHEKGDGKYVLSREPEFILLGNVAVLPYRLDEKTIANRLSLKSEHELWANPEFHKRYEMVCVQVDPSSVLRYFVFYKRVDVQFASLSNVALDSCDTPTTEIGGLP